MTLDDVGTFVAGRSPVIQKLSDFGQILVHWFRVADHTPGTFERAISRGLRRAKIPEKIELRIIHAAGTYDEDLNFADLDASR